MLYLVLNRFITSSQSFYISQKAIIFDVRTRPSHISTKTGSKDLQDVSLILRVLHKPEIEQLPKIYRSLGTDYDQRVLPSIGNEVLKATVAQFDASELITQREIVSARIREDLLKRAREFGITLDDVSIVSEMTFSSSIPILLTLLLHLIAVTVASLLLTESNRIRLKRPT